MSFFIPELLSPAGSLEKLKTACYYGANAVYLSGQEFGLRTAADNFTNEELKIALDFCHNRNVLVYLVLNSFLNDQDLESLKLFLIENAKLNFDACIVSDLGVFETVKKNSRYPIHVSTQASVLNTQSAMFWKELGAKRVILGRECSIKQAGEIKQSTGLEVELFIHGSMCMSYSGHCVISNFTQGRDSNRGGCAQSCRFEYSLSDNADKEQVAKKAYFMSSKDLMGLRVLEDYIKYEIDSLKIEGRMKSSLYAGAITKVYAQALDYYKTHGHFLSDDLLKWENELGKVPHRTYTEASLQEEADASSVFNERELENELSWKIAGKVLENNPKSQMIVEVKNAFDVGQVLEVISFKGDNIFLKCLEICDVNWKSLNRTKPSTLIRLPYDAQVEVNTILRMKS